MLKLSGKAISSNIPHTNIFSLSTNPNLPLALRSQKALVIHNNDLIPDGFNHYIITSGSNVTLPEFSSFTILDESFRYLNNDDVVSISKGGYIRTLFRASSTHNSILLKK